MKLIDGIIHNIIARIGLALIGITIAVAGLLAPKTCIRLFDAFVK